MKHAMAALLLVAAGCRGADEEEMPAPEAGTDVDVDEDIYRGEKSSELGTDRLRNLAKTIEWPAISTEEGASYAGDAVIVDRIQREDASNVYGVRVRLKNTTNRVQKLEYLIKFVVRDGGEILGHAGGWKAFVIDPFGFETVGDTAKVPGAEGFRLFIRGSGAKSDGLPDDPAGREARRRERERQKAEGAAPADSGKQP